MQALEMLRELATTVSPECAHRDPIGTWEHLAANDSVGFCPFAYGYSNFARNGYAKHPIEFGGLIVIDGHHRCRSTLGGAGLAVSSYSRHIETAVEYCRFVSCPDSQQGLYFTSGGQPGHRSAWLASESNRVSNNFFKNTLSTLDTAWVRPRWNGYLHFQERAGAIVHRYMWGGGNARDEVCKLNGLATESLRNPEHRSDNEAA